MQLITQQNWGTYLASAIELAQESFTPIQHIGAELEIDPDTNEKRVVIEIAVNASVDEALAMKKNFTHRWIEAAPPEVRERIRFLYNLP